MFGLVRKKTLERCLGEVAAKDCEVATLIEIKRGLEQRVIELGDLHQDHDMQATAEVRARHSLAHHGVTLSYYAEEGNTDGCPNHVNISFHPKLTANSRVYGDPHGDPSEWAVIERMVQAMPAAPWFLACDAKQQIARVLDAPVSLIVIAREVAGIEKRLQAMLDEAIKMRDLRRLFLPEKEKTAQK